MKRPSFQFYPGDWQGDHKLRSCSPTARCLWLEMMCIFHQSKPYGYMPNFLLKQIPSKMLAKDQANLEQLLDLCSGFVEQLAQMTAMRPEVVGPAWVELLRKEIPYIDENGQISSKRMVKDEYIRQVRASAGKLGGNPLLIKGDHDDEYGVLLNQNSSKTKPNAQAKVRANHNQGAKQTSKQNPTPSSSSSSSSSSIESKDLVSYGDLSKPGFSTGRGGLDENAHKGMKNGHQVGAEMNGHSVIVDAFALPHEVAQESGSVSPATGSSGFLESVDDEAASPCPHQEIISLYHELLPGLSRVKKARWEGSESARNLATRWREGMEAGRRGVDLASFAFQTRAQGMEAMRLFFGLVKESPLLLGEVPNKNGNRAFVADLRWLVKRSNFDKVLQGNYLDRGVAQKNGDGAYTERKPSRLGLKPGETYDRFADYASRGEFAEDESEKDKRILLFEGGVYLFGEQIVLLEKTDGDLVRQAIEEYKPFDQVARVALEKLPKKVEITRRCRLNGLVNDSPDIPIEPDEMPVFGPFEEKQDVAI